MFISLSDYYMIDDSDGFSFQIDPLPSGEHHWIGFFQGFATGYERRNIDPVPELFRYVVWVCSKAPNFHGEKDVWSDLKKALPRYADRIDRLMLLV